MLASNRATTRPTRTIALGAVGGCVLIPAMAWAQASPFLTGANALQSNILAWLTPVAVILVMALGAMAMANRIIENCSNTLILRCSGSDQGGTAAFASRLIGEREIVRRQISHGRDREDSFGQRTRRSQQISEQQLSESAVLASQLEQLPDLSGYLKTASSRSWRRAQVARSS
jgi:Type IV secretion-system coupling protein DNA-binding domain